ncbi:MAG: pyridoxal phosphate-dependent aminotransferase [Arenibacterium sp.]
MQLSQRITGLNGGGPDGWEVFLRARKMIAEGRSVTELTIGEHDIRTHPSILDAMDEAARAGHTGYAMVPGNDQLRDRVAARITERTGVRTTRDNVLITPGGQSALFVAHHAVCDEGDIALYIDPYYATYPGTLRAVGAIPRAVPTLARHAFQPQKEPLAEASKGATSLLINSPNNPTGAVYSRETLASIAEVCRKEDLWLISDEVYDTQIWSGSHVSPRTLPEMKERTIVVGSMSKSHAMTGSRCGWVVAPEEAIWPMIDLATSTTYGVPGFIQLAADYALEQGRALEDEIATPFRRRRDLAQDVLGSQNTVGMIPSEGAMYLMLDIRATGLDGKAFADRLLDEHAIAVMPGESFGMSAAGHIRVAMTVEDSAFKAALTTLCTFANDLANT